MTSASPRAAAGERSRALAIVDCDVHPIVRGGVEGLLPYVSAGRRRRLAGRGAVAESPFPPIRYAHPLGFLREDARTPDGGPAGSDPRFLVEDHVERHRIGSLLLLSLQAGALAGWTDADEAIELATAYNRFFVEEWLPVDPRFTLAVVVAPHDPEAAAREIARWDDEEQVVGVFLPLLDRLMGNRFYYPVYAAAAERGLPVVVHGSGAETIFAGAPGVAGGVPSSYVERYVQLPQVAQSNVVSLVFEGVFERFPTLKVAFPEWGFSWIVPLLWRMDKAWKGLRVDAPWVRRPPSEYVRDHIRFTTEPIDEPERDEHLHRILEMAGAERTLMFSSDYPHWDNDTPAFVFGKLPRELRSRVASENALETFGDRMRRALERGAAKGG